MPQPTIPEVVDVDVQVGEDGGRRIGQGVEHLDHAALFRNENPVIGAEPDHVGLVRPLNAIDSWNPAGSTAACADPEVVMATTAPAISIRRLRSAA